MTTEQDITGAQNRPDDRKSRILRKPLPQILNEMEDLIMAAAEAARRAESAAEAAAGIAKRADEETTKRIQEAVARAQEAKLFVEDAVSRAEQLANAAKATEEEMDRRLKEIAEKAVREFISSWEAIAVITVLVLAIIFAAVAISAGLLSLVP